MDDIKETNKELEGKKKQKPGLNAVRPDDYVEKKFKNMAKDKNMTQTEMFNCIFWNYITDKNNDRKQSALDLESEINLISKDLNNLLQHFKAISDKAQNTVISLKTNAEQNEKNLNLDIDTLNKKLEELKKRNDELEQSNSAFNEIKDGLEDKIKEFIKLLEEKDVNFEKAAKLISDKDNEISLFKNLNKNLEDQLKKSNTEVNRISKELESTAERVRTLEKSNVNLNETINTLDILKKAEIEAIESKYKLYITDLEAKIKSFDELKEREINQIKNNLKTEYEADKKMAIADMKLELSEVKSKYAETLIELNQIKNSIKLINSSTSEK